MYRVFLRAGYPHTVMFSNVVRSAGLLARAVPNRAAAGRLCSGYGGTDSGEFTAPADSYVPEPTVGAATDSQRPYGGKFKLVVAFFSGAPRDGEVHQQGDALGPRRARPAAAGHRHAPRRHVPDGDELQVGPNAWSFGSRAIVRNPSHERDAITQLMLHRN